MRCAGTLLLAGTLGCAGMLAHAQPRPELTTVEPGLEQAVRWKWRVLPTTDAGWGIATPVVPPPRDAPPGPGNAGGGPVAGAPPSAARTDLYVVRKGDALYTIGRRFKVPVDILKSVNGLTTDTIRAGQELRIPSPAEVAALRPALPTPTPKAAAARPAADAFYDRGALVLQVFLDRALFPTGPIDGQNGPALFAAQQRFLAANPEVGDAVALAQMATQQVTEPLTRYTLRPVDFRFIAPPRAQAAGSAPREASASKAPAPADQAAKPTYDDLTSVPQLVYRTPWEFVAERFHCNEAFLRKLNANIRGVPTVGDELRVPNVEPFEIERVPAFARQPLADPANAFTAAVVNGSWLEIARNGRVIAAAPLSIARPRLSGRGTWKILDLVSRPRLATRRELMFPPQPPTRIYGRADPNATPIPTPTPLAADEIIEAGPNNPAGVLWLQLARAEETEPLPYGLTGTSVPDDMPTTESIGGLRLTNWDIARLVRFLPAGTPLEWRSGPAAATRPPAAPVP